MLAPEPNSRISLFSLALLALPRFGAASAASAIATSASSVKTTVGLRPGLPLTFGTSTGARSGLTTGSGGCTCLDNLDSFSTTFGVAALAPDCVLAVVFTTDFGAAIFLSTVLFLTAAGALAAGFFAAAFFLSADTTLVVVFFASTFLAGTLAAAFFAAGAFTAVFGLPDGLVWADLTL